MSTVRRNATFIIVYFVGVAVYLWFDPIACEDVSDLAGVLIPVIGGLGLVWANARSFAGVRSWWRRMAARTAVVGVMFAALSFFVHTYSWHIRPALGLQCKPTTGRRTGRGNPPPSPARSVRQDMSKDAEFVMKTDA